MWLVINSTGQESTIFSILIIVILGIIITSLYRVLQVYTFKTKDIYYLGNEAYIEVELAV